VQRRAVTERQTAWRTMLEGEGNMNAQLSGHEEVIANYGNCPSQLEAALLGLSEINLDLRTSAEGWSIRDIVHHIADGDDMWKMFIKQAIGNPGSEFYLNWYWQVPQDEWAKSWNYKERLIGPSLAMFRANRSHIVQLLRSTPGAMEKRLRVCWPKIGEREVMVASILEGQTQHAIEHIAEIDEIRGVHSM
jgi:hypothetical protein